jgi:alpha-beta hydrolase superfamily lysophospholipase
MTHHDQRSLSRAHTRGPTLYSYFASPDGKPAAVVGIVHGAFEYGERYAHVMDAWAEQGIASVAIDMRGHGRAGGRRGYCERFEEFLDDTLELEGLVAETKVPALLFGHSFGGLVAASTALARPTAWRALVLSSPFFDVAMEVPWPKMVAARVASRILPTFAMRNGIRSSDVTHDAALARAYDEDPLTFHTATARWYTETRIAQERALAKATSIDMPLYVVVGTADRLVKTEAARSFFDRVSSSDKTWDERAGLFHEVLNEPEWRGIADKLGEWILAHANHSAV